MRALILGASGTLGQALTVALKSDGVSLQALGRAGCDITDAAAVSRIVSEMRPDVVFNTGAYTNVDKAESDVDAAFAANAVGPENVARACAAVGAAMVHFSTDFVFDGEQERPYDEFDTALPQGVYARSKLAGDRLVAAALPRSFILRVGCLYGWGGHNFPSSLVRRLRAGELVRADKSRQASPTWVVPVCRVSLALARTQHYGLYHCTANGETSWADYAGFLAAQLGLAATRVEALDTGSLKLAAPRPRRAILDNRMLRLRGLDTLGTWREQALAFLAADPG